MKTKAYIISAAILIITTYLTYYLYFHKYLEYQPTKDPAVWGQFGDYTGGVLNPLLSFLSILLLIKSLALQYEANRDLKSEIKNGEKTEKLRSFEILFFNLISSQKNLFDSFEIDANSSKRESPNIRGAKAVLEIENQIEIMREAGKSDEEISEYLTAIDSDDRIFGISRAFYIAVMIITEKLSESNGFSKDDRETHFKALINFTDFAQLRLVMICIQFLDYESTKYLRSSTEFQAAIEKLGLNYKLY